MTDRRPQVDLALLERTTEETFSPNELRRKLMLGRPLRVKYGADVTAPFLHIGHAVNLWMMRHLQEHGHKVVFLIGDFTTRIGDPTGKDRARSRSGPETRSKWARSNGSGFGSEYGDFTAFSWTIGVECTSRISRNRPRGDQRTA